MCEKYWEEVRRHRSYALALLDSAINMLEHFKEEAKLADIDIDTSKIDDIIQTLQSMLEACKKT